MLTSKSRRSAVWIAVALAGPLVLAAQVTTKTAVLGDAGGSCPVSLHARQGSGGDMLKVAKEHPNESGQLIQISISDPEPGRHAISARLTVRGLTAKGRAVSAPTPLESAMGSSPSIAISAVITMGRTREAAPSRIASICPIFSRLRSRMRLTKITLF